MFVRPISRSAETLPAAETVDTYEPDAEPEAVPVAAPLDLHATSPFRLLSRALWPAAVAVVSTMLLFAIVPSQVPLAPVAGKSLPTAVVPAGTVLAKTEGVTKSQNYTVTFPAGTDSTLMLVWDYAAEDGDMVSILVNGNPMGEPFTIMHGAKVLRVPTNADIGVIGTHDGGGGITYAVNFPEGGRSMVNGIQTGETNHYALQVRNTDTGKSP